MANRVCFVVDGFNLYHSLKDAQRDTGVNCRWLDIRSLCDSFLSAIGGGATTEAVYYFSALAHHREDRQPGTVARHEAYIEALEGTGVSKSLAAFKPKTLNYQCGKCSYHGTFVRHEEKETDVAVASKVIELAVGNAADTVVVLSGDTDVLPAIRTALQLSTTPIYMLFPYRRHNNAFAAVASGQFKIKAHHYRAHQLPDPAVTSRGSVARPPRWA